MTASLQSEPDAYVSVLKRVGLVLVIVGLLGVAHMIYCVIREIAYSSSFNVLAVAAGIFLMRGSLRAAARIRSLAAFLLRAFAAVPVACPFLQPPALTLTKIRLNPDGFALGVRLMLFYAALLVWVIKQLDSGPVRQAQANAGNPVRSLKVPRCAGFALVGLIATAIPWMLSGETAMRAQAVAAKEVGPGYRLHVSALSVTTGGGRTAVSALVTAWNDTEVRDVPVYWEEP